MDDLSQYIKALTITPDTYLFVDIDVINPEFLTQILPAGVKFFGVPGGLKVEAFTREQLQAILYQKCDPVEGSLSDADIQIINDGLLVPSEKAVHLMAREIRGWRGVPDPDAI